MTILFVLLSTMQNVFKSVQSIPEFENVLRSKSIMHDATNGWVLSVEVYIQGEFIKNKKTFIKYFLSILDQSCTSKNYTIFKNNEF